MTPGRRTISLQLAVEDGEARRDQRSQSLLRSDLFVFPRSYHIMSCASPPQNTRRDARARAWRGQRRRGRDRPRRAHARTHADAPAGGGMARAGRGQAQEGNKGGSHRHVACFRNQTHPIEMQLQASRQAAINNAGPIL